MTTQPSDTTGRSINFRSPSGGQIGESCLIPQMHLSLDPAITSGMYHIYIYVIHISHQTNRKKGTAQMKMTSAGQVTVHPYNEICCSYEREWGGFPTDVEMHARYVIKEIRIYILLLMMMKL